MVVLVDFAVLAAVFLGASSPSASAALAVFLAGVFLAAVFLAAGLAAVVVHGLRGWLRRRRAERDGEGR